MLIKEPFPLRASVPISLFDEWYPRRHGAGEGTANRM